MSNFRSLDDLSVAGRTVIVRVDLNVPMQAGRVTDATRIERVAPTLRELLDKGAKVVVLSHFDRPKGKYVPGMSLSPLVDVLGSAVGREDIRFGVDCVGAEALKAVGETPMGGIVLMENLRFHAGEEGNDPAFAAQLAELGEFYVNDAFSCSHRAHASVVGLAERLPSAAGRLMQAELEALEKAFASPKRPLLALVGGSKVSSKLELLENIVARVDMLVIGGAMANTFLYAQGKSVGASLVERDMADTARAILKAAEAKGCRILLPVDVTAADAFRPQAPCRIVPVDAIPDDHLILDVGPRSCAALVDAIDEARTMVWNGPLGAFETSPFDAGTVIGARAVAANTRAGTLMSVAGGGDTVAALSHAGVAQEFSYVSTAGGAFLEWMEGKTLPGVAALAGLKQAA